MSFLLGDEYASSSNETESDEDENVAKEIVKKADSNGKGLTQILPSADHILSSVSTSTASFLPLNPSTKFQSIVEAFDLIAEQTIQYQVKKEEEEKREQYDIHHIDKKHDRKRVMPMQETEFRAKEPSLKRERKDAKERVKDQRMKGQAGIGSDFRVWKTEPEMVLRQQFD